MKCAIPASTTSPAASSSRSRCTNATESLSWNDGYKMTQQYSAKLTVTADAKEGIRAFLEKRKPKYGDK